MGKIFVLMGKSSSGKDTVFRRLMEEPSLNLHTIVPGTTRPIRKGETPGVEYYFYTQEQLDQLAAEHKIIELRSYHTVHGLWNYFTMDDGQIDLAQKDYLVIGTLESYRKMQEYFGSEALIPLFLTLDDGLRLQRALDRERKQDHPRYEELCRRFLADQEDFSPEHLAEAGICQIFVNSQLEDTVAELTSYIQEVLS